MAVGYVFDFINDDLMIYYNSIRKIQNRGFYTIYHFVHLHRFILFYYTNLSFLVISPSILLNGFYSDCFLKFCISPSQMTFKGLI